MRRSRLRGDPALFSAAGAELQPSMPIPGDQPRICRPNPMVIGL
jgi:hypothetical protein